MENFKQRADFRTLLRSKLTELLGKYGYDLAFDNQNQDQSISKNWICRLICLGKKRVEIHNDDWRDYTEYFIVKVDDKEIFMLNLDNYKSIEVAFEEIKSKLIDKV
ncbi:hypothetical protein QTN47_26365 [Danxiaibacter flavus]|uniref:Uncharacterized protein n=1 Tax=Danxiaibacter flavus TaxID=3049108 RepID=A0ABV3ZME7_9BACT|nr:hypothetical protein QNM32_26365 [Chitinophagaceae bacterium DXS]